MGKKKKEHIVFDLTLKQKKSIPFSILNKGCPQKQKRKPMKGAKNLERISKEEAFGNRNSICAGDIYK